MPFRFPYHLGGRISPDAIHTHRFDILGVVLPSFRFKYSIRNKVTIAFRFKYHLNTATTLVTIPFRFQYNITGRLVVSMRFLYSMEDADIRRTGRGKPFRPALIIRSVDNRIILLQYNSFRINDTPTIKVNEMNVRLAEDSAGDFSILLEDHARVIDTSLIKEGCRVEIRASKVETTLFDADSYLFSGIIKSKTVIRQDMGTLEYRFEGFGLQTRFNERITNFVYAARKTSFDNPAPDPTDPNMLAYKLVSKLVSGTDHLPLGFPSLGLPYIGDTDQTLIPTDFIPAVNEEFTEMSGVMALLSDSTGAVWGVNTAGKTYFHYPTVEHSGVVVKSTVEESLNAETGQIVLVDDPVLTSYIVGAFSFTDSITKEDGFTNRFFAKVTRKEQVGNNVINLTDARENFTPLFADQGGEEQEPEQGPLGVGGDIINDPASATAGLYWFSFFGFETPDAQPGTPEYTAGWNIVANVARQYPTVKFVIALNIYTGLGRPSTANLPDGNKVDWTNNIRTLKNAGISVLGIVDGNHNSFTEAQIIQDINTFLDTFPDLDGMSVNHVDNIDENTYRTMYANIATHIKTTRAKKLAVAHGMVGYVTPTWLANTAYDIFLLAQQSTLPPASQAFNTWYTQTPPKRRAIIVWDINANKGYNEAMIRQWINDYVDQSICSYFYVDHEPQARALVAVSDWMGTVAQELQKIQNQGASGTPGAAQSVPRDLAQSFVPTSTDLSDVMLLLSKVGNPTWIPGTGFTGNPQDNAQANTVHGHITSSATLTYQEIDSATGEVVTRITEQPSNDVLGFFGFPFDSIGTDPTIVFLNNVKMNQKLIPGRRYWIVLFGRGQSELQTIRWHHSDKASDTTALSAERAPGGHNAVQNWQVFTKSQSPGFALSYFDRTLDFVEASDSDSIEAFDLVESEIDLSFIEDEILAAKFLQTIVNQTSRPKRIYDMGRITAPDKLLLPGHLVTIVDELSGHGKSGPDVIDAEIIEAEYNFSAYEHPLGAFYISIRPIGYVDFAYQLWKKKLDRGEIAIPNGEDVVVTPPPPPPPPSPPPPPGPPPPPPPPGPPPPPPSPPPPPPSPPPAAPPDLDTSGITRTRGPYTTYQDFLSAVNGAAAGDMIILANGSYSIPSSTNTDFTRSGTTTNPIIVRAEQVGGVTLTGSAGYNFSNCDNFTWYGFTHRHDDTGLLHIQNGCNNFRFARCDVSLADGTTRKNWLMVEDSTKVRIDHCYFHDKSTQGYYIGFGYDADVSAANGAIVEYCRFRNHTAPGSPPDSGEAVMIGASGQARHTFSVTFRYNYIDNNNGDGEVVGTKSCGNLIYHNSFVNNDAALSLRHGDTNTVIGNYFEATGLRLGGADNIVANNFITLIPSGRREARRGLVLNNGDAERPTSGVHYERVVNNLIVYNTFANGTGTSEWVVGWGGYNGGSLVPTGNTFRGNIIKCQNGSLFTFENGSSASGNTITNNIGHVTSNGSYADFSTNFGDRADPGIAQGSDGIWRISGTGSLAHHYLSNSSNIFSSTTTEDIDGDARTNRSDCGADHYSTAAKPKKRITVDDVGPAASTVIIT